MDGSTLSYVGYDPEQEGLREALCTLANGYVGTRGAAPESRADDVHYPGTYVAGVYNRLSTDIEGRDVENESIVNLPNWLPLTFSIDDGPWFDIDEAEVLEHEQTLELRRGVLIRRFRVRDDHGRETSVSQQRIVHMEHEHVMAIRMAIRPENWSGRITVRSGLDGGVRNQGVERYRDLADRHLEIVETAAVDDDTVLLACRTVQSRIEIVQAARTRLRIDGERSRPDRHHDLSDEVAALELSADLNQGATCEVEKVVTLYTSRDPAISEPRESAVEAAAHAPAFDELLTGHVTAWEALWRRYDIRVDGNDQAEHVLDVHLFHLLQVATGHAADRDVGVPARGLHGEAYRGHIFWDELFVFPLLSYRSPSTARELLRYRHRRLPAARHAARAAGLDGAMYPWQSASSEREEAQEVHLNPESGRWVPDETHRQRHINLAVAYNVWQYVQITGDVEFLAEAGAEMILEIARLFASLVTYDAIDDRYDLVGVVGPDEFHVDDPHWDGTGLRNNAYTNVMVAWLLIHAPRLVDQLPTLQRDAVIDRLRLRSDEFDRWEDISHKLRVAFHGEGIISQFEGFDRLEELDWDAYRERYGDIHRLDRILEAEGDDVNRYQVTKQADALMLFYLLSYEELCELFDHLGYHFDDEMLHRTLQYYLARTSHGSTLSRVVHSWVLARADRRASLALFCEALETDVADIQGGTTREGIHVGAMAATVDLAERGYSGMEVREGLLRFKPSLPDGIDLVEFRIFYQCRWITVSLCGDEIVLRSDPAELEPVDVAYRDDVRRLAPGGTLRFRPMPPGADEAEGAVSADEGRRRQRGMSAPPRWVREGQERR